MPLQAILVEFFCYYLSNSVESVSYVPLKKLSKLLESKKSKSFLHAYNISSHQMQMVIS